MAPEVEGILSLQVIISKDNYTLLVHLKYVKSVESIGSLSVISCCDMSNKQLAGGSRIVCPMPLTQLVCIWF